MLPKISRFLLVALSVITLSCVLPAIYHTFFTHRVNIPMITYSEINNDFIMMLHDNGITKYRDTKGKEYTQQEFLRATPVSNYQYHLSNGTMPDSIQGVAINLPLLQRENFRQLILPQQLSMPDYQIYVMYESEPEFGLRLPSDVFRINQQIEFIDCKSNSVNEEKSNLFTGAMHEKGFSFPAKLVSGMPTSMKNRDDGWFVLDNKGQLFHLKMVQKQPVCKQIILPDGMDIRHIICNDFNANEFYAMVITADNSIYVLKTADYSLVNIPIAGYNRFEHMLIFSGNMFGKTLTLFDDAFVKSVAFNKLYEKINEHQLDRPLASEQWFDKLGDVLFPYQLKLDNSKSGFFQFDFNGSNSYYFIIFNILLVAIFIFTRPMKTIGWQDQLLEIGLILFTGIFGFLSVLLFSYKKY